MEILIQSQAEFDRSTQLRSCKWHFCTELLSETDLINHVKIHAAECRPIKRKQHNLNLLHLSSNESSLDFMKIPPPAQVVTQSDRIISFDFEVADTQITTFSSAEEILGPAIPIDSTVSLEQTNETKNMLDWLSSEGVAAVEPQLISIPLPVHLPAPLPAPVPSAEFGELITQVVNGMGEESSSFGTNSSGEKGNESSISWQGGLAQPR